MTTHPDPWPTGTPAWADITVPDLDRAVDFYGALLGWTFERGGPEVGGYTQALVDGRRVVGLGEPTGEDPAPPSAWCVYLATEDLAATTQAVTDAGGEVLLPAMEILHFGDMAIFVDPTGAVFGGWQHGEHTGWDVTDEPGAVVWTEVMSHDHAASLEFYRRVFGFTADDMSGPGFTYSSVRLDGQLVCGIGAYSDKVDPATPAAWTLYFGTADTDAAAQRVTELGGTVMSEPADTPYGRMAIVAGPFGEVFALINAGDDEPG
ncbi:VOC family protein [Cellulomonas fimi]|uniref:Glyoxalase/bleomycin resistance protein/dioxygenase n=1 Tax=Cellulomonas fimi (strain ATCC 484 / DSM 20113 / JCM 1341 / CCUG 24087 / LMG 16345 / NBRC 15513 / NCIMB 8980 / NCTC 7547 / NRS-133) TaxID=590998 RepID=F4H333_CELFA|nr:VOC family protein [Cellulomonas fimi]AEE47651.1 Glyoxalase/bleomycin resistance protein/dioxygenase [Cellulomonas fimi ATCC 484]NNH09026.1 VOC family protein [Cellulomonas fimi]VEH36723.1 27 kDa antigen Cfp30B [Cellulomonas fimi]